MRFDPQYDKLAEPSPEITAKHATTLLENISDAFLTVDSAWRLTYANRSTRQMLGDQGIKADTVIGMPYFDAFPEARDTDLGRAMERSMAERVAIDMEAFYPPFQRWYNVHFFPVEDGGISVLAQDTTERRNSDERFRSAVESAPTALLLVDGGGKIALVNGQAEKLFGYSRKDLLGLSVEMLVPDRYRSGHRNHRMEFATNPQARLMGAGRDQFCVRKNGTEVPAEIGLNPIRTPEGDFVLISVIDISERKRSEEQLREKAAQLSLVADTAPVYIFHCNTGQRFKFVNKSFAELFGVTQEHCIGKSMAEVIGKSAYDLCHEYVETALQGIPIEFEMEAPHGTTGRHILHCSYAPELDAAGEVLGWVAAFIDVTEKRHAESVARHSHEMEILNQRLLRAMAETHHRVKNNLQVISALVEMQTAGGADYVPIDEMKQISQHIGALASLHDLLTKEAQNYGDVEHLPLKDLLTELMPLLQPSLGQRALRYEAEEVMVSVRQATSLALVINELVSNASKHGAGEVSVGITVGGEFGKLTVSDRGAGFQSGFEIAQHSNTGLKLVSQIVRWDMGGEIELGRSPKGGAEINVTFPLHARITAQLATSAR